MRMDKVVNMMLVIIAGLCITGCSKDEPGDDGYLLMSESRMTVNGDGETTQVSWITEGEWNATVDADWISLEQTNGVGNATVKVNVIPNYGGDYRMGTVKVKKGGAVREIMVLQPCSSMTEAETIICNGNGETRDIKLGDELVSGEIKVLATERYFDESDDSAAADAAWFSTSKAGNVLTVTVSAIDDAVEARTAELIVSKDGYEKRIHIIQGEFEVYDSPKDVSMELKGFDKERSGRYINELYLDCGKSRMSNSTMRKTSNLRCGGAFYIPFSFSYYPGQEAKINPGYYRINAYNASGEFGMVEAGGYFTGAKDDMELSKTGIRCINHVTNVVYNGNTPYEMVLIGSGYESGCVVVEKVSEDKAYIYLVGNHSNISYGRINPEEVGHAYRFRIDGSMVRDGVQL